jgi:transcriptional regulator with XRE-family HTH domain
MSADILDELAEVVKPVIAVQAANPQAIQKINYSHDGMINLIITHRGISQNQIAAHFGYSASWVSQVMSSDAFQARLAERAAEIEDPTIRATVEEGLKGLITRSVEIIKEKLKGEPSSIPDNLAIRTLELSTRALGMGAKAPTVVVNNNQVENHLEVLGGRLTDLLTRKRTETTQPILEQSNG